MKSPPVIACARCNEKYPHTYGNWPNTSFAECWRCFVKDNLKSRRETMREAMIGGIGLAVVTLIIGFFAGWFAKGGW